MKYTFDENLKYGMRMENIVVNYFEKELNLKLIGGDVDGKIFGKSIIEELCNCKYIPIVERENESSLEFVNDKGILSVFTMPDKLFDTPSSDKRWVEVKSTRGYLNQSIWINRKKVEDYANVKKYSNIPVFIVMIEIVEGWAMINLRWTTPQQVLKVGNGIEFIKEKDVYKILIGEFPKINEFPIHYLNYSDNQ